MSAIELLPDGGAGRPCRAVRRLRLDPHRLQLLPQPALPEVPGRRRARSGSPTRQAELLPVPYFHVVFTLPAPVGRDRLPEQGRWSTPSCSAPRPRRCAPSPPTPSTSAPRSASSPCCTPGARPCTIIRTSIASCPAAACRPTAPAGSPAGPASSCRSACSRRLFRRLFLQSLQAAFDAGQLGFFGDLADLADARRLRRPPATSFGAHRLGRLRQAAVRRPRAGAGLSRPLHPSRRHRQLPPGRAGRRPGRASAGRTIATTASPRS